MVRSGGVETIGVRKGTTRHQSRPVLKADLTAGAVVAWAEDALVVGTATRLWRGDHWIAAKEAIVAVAATSTRVAACSKTRVSIYDNDLVCQESIEGCCWRSCAFAGETLCVVGSDRTILSWNIGDCSEWPGARCVAALGHERFVVTRDAPLRLTSDPGQIESSRRLHGELSPSGFGGGEIPSYLLIDRRDDAHPTLCVISRRGERSAPLDGMGLIVDLVAASSLAVLVASSFSDKIAVFSSESLQPLAVVALPEVGFALELGSFRGKRRSTTRNCDRVSAVSSWTTTDLSFWSVCLLLTC